MPLWQCWSEAGPKAGLTSRAEPGGRWRRVHDLRSIVRYIAQDNPSRARKFGKNLREKVHPPAHHPLLGHEGRPGLPAGVRELVLHPSYIAFYRVIDTSRTVEILRVKHVAQQTP